jgi:uncharacterized protein YjdB
MTLTVTAATLVSIGVTPANPSIANGTSQQFTATGIYTDHSTQNLTGAVAWSSANTAVAAVSNAVGSNGLATAASQGSTTITAALGSVSGSMTLTVTAATLVSIGVTPANPSIANGTSQQFTATGIYTDHSTQNLTTSVTWGSSDPTVVQLSNASGSNGLATAASQGSVTITATVGSVSGSMTLTVTAANLVSIEWSALFPSLAGGTSEQFIAIGVYSDNSTQSLTTSVTWTSSNPLVAAVSNASGSNGFVTALSQGSTTITAALGSVSVTSALTVTPATLVSLGVTPAYATIAKGTSLQFTAVGIFSDNSTQDLTDSVYWISDNNSISNAPGSQGLLTAVTLGTDSIAAITNNPLPWIESLVAALTVTPAPLVSITVAPSNASIAKGTTQQFTATGTYADGSTQDLTSSVTWYSWNTYAASISNAAGSQGLATGTNQDTSPISCNIPGVLISCPDTSLTVTAATLVSIDVALVNATIPNGTETFATATGIYSDGSTQDLSNSVAWSSSNTSVASAVGSGYPQLNYELVFSQSPGSTTITAALGSLSASTTLTVTPATLASITVTPANGTARSGFDIFFTATGNYTDKSTQDITTLVTWSSSKASLVSISNAPGSRGMAHAYTGSVTITAALGSVSGETTLTVN